MSETGRVVGRLRRSAGVFEVEGSPGTLAAYHRANEVFAVGICVEGMLTTSSVASLGAANRLVALLVATLRALAKGPVTIALVAKVRSRVHATLLRLWGVEGGDGGSGRTGDRAR